MNLSIIKQLHAKNHDFSVYDSDGNQIIHTNPGTHEIRYLLEHKLCDVNSPNAQGRTLMHMLLVPQNALIALDFHGDVNAKDKRGMTPLHTSHSSVIVDILLAAGADPNVADIDGKTPIFYAMSDASLKLFINAGARVDVADKDGNTPLHYMCNHTMMRTLIMAGANVDAVNKLGNTPLHMCKQEKAIFLVEHGADVNKKNAAGFEPISNVAFGSKVTFAMLIHGANIPVPPFRALHKKCLLAQFLVLVLL